MPAVEHAVIAAAGLGSRLGHGKPKALVEVGGAPLIHHQLRLLAEVPDIRVVVGFNEQAVIDTVRAVRQDVVFVRNPAFRTTTTLTSYAMGAAHLKVNCLFMDADILFEPKSFAAFVRACVAEEKLVAVTKSKTTDAVFAHIGNGSVERFSRSDWSQYEWANLCWLPPGYCEAGEGAVFERFERDLPIRCFEIEAYEVDTPEDLDAAVAYAARGQ